MFTKLLTYFPVSPAIWETFGGHAFWRVICSARPVLPHASHAHPVLGRQQCTRNQHALASGCLQEGQPADPEERPSWPWWKAKKWALHCAYRLFSRYSDPKRCRDNENDKAFAQMFVVRGQYAP